MPYRAIASPPRKNSANFYRTNTVIFDGINHGLRGINTGHISRLLQAKRNDRLCKKCKSRYTETNTEEQKPNSGGLRAVIYLPWRPSLEILYTRTIISPRPSAQFIKYMNPLNARESFKLGRCTRHYLENREKKDTYMHKTTKPPTLPSPPGNRYPCLSRSRAVWPPSPAESCPEPEPPAPPRPPLPSPPPPRLCRLCHAS